MIAAQSKAVFLSYASQDADAARRICEALRAAGVEVWFDLSELRGGDAWDQKIRKQIKECALFVPIISANTQARLEGYFRLEWKLAAQRTHTMADAKPFLVPVCTDETHDADAHVPEEFRAVQWTRLPRGETDNPFCARVRVLLDGLVDDAGRRFPSRNEQVNVRGAAGNRRVPRFWLIMVAGAGAAVAVAIWRPWAKGARDQAEATRLAPAPVTRTPVQAATEVEKFQAQIWAIYDKQTDATREERTLAEELGAQAVKLEPANAEAWAAYAVAAWANWYYYGRAKQGQAQALRHAERAFALDKHSRAARLALANVQRQNAPTRGVAERTLRDLIAEDASDRRALRLLAYVLRDQALSESDRAKRDALVQEALGLLDRAAALPGGDPSALLGKANMLASGGRYGEARAAVAESLRLRNGPNAFAIHVNLMFQLEGDLEGAVAALDRAPAEFWAKEPSIAFATWLVLCQRDTRRAHTYLRMITSDFVDAGGSNLEGDVAMPRGVLAGLMHEIDRRPAMAKTEWQAALRVVDQRLEADRTHAAWLYWKAWLHAAVGEAEEARATMRKRATATRLAPVPSPAGISIRRGIGGANEIAHVYLRCGDIEDVLAALEREVVAIRAQANQADLAALLGNRLRFDPNWDGLRREERFASVLRDLQSMAKANPAR